VGGAEVDGQHVSAGERTGPPEQPEQLAAPSA
jgi:hypothetical protein